MNPKKNENNLPSFLDWFQLKWKDQSRKTTPTSTNEISTSKTDEGLESAEKNKSNFNSSFENSVFEYPILKERGMGEDPSNLTKLNDPNSSLMSLKFANLNDNSKLKKGLESEMPSSDKMPYSKTELSNKNMFEKNEKTFKNKASRTNSEQNTDFIRKQNFQNPKNRSTKGPFYPQGTGTRSTVGEGLPTEFTQQASLAGTSTFRQTKPVLGKNKSDSFKGKEGMGGKTWFRPTDPTKQQVVSITYEEIGLFPRSFNRVFDRFFKQLFFDVENLVIQEYRFYRYLFLTTVKCLFILIFVPFLVNFICKNYLVRPITEYYWNSKQPEIFLNSYQQKRAFSELKDFEEKIYFESLIVSAPHLTNSSILTANESGTHSKIEFSSLQTQTLNAENSSVPESALHLDLENNKIRTKKLEGGIANSVGNLQTSQAGLRETESFNERAHLESAKGLAKNPTLSNRHRLDETVQQLLQNKTLELANHYNEESIESITNFFADLISFSTLCFLLFNLEIQINITKSFLLEVFFGLDDSKKSLLILFITDLLVGYHSPNIWELFFSSLFDHYGLPESQTTIFLLVATLPVLLDVLFKYLIFRHLNRASPATVATYHAMIE